MNVELAESAGYCFGVRRALDKVEEQIAKSDGTQKIYTYGQIIHNSEVTGDLERRGVGCIDTPEEIKEIRGQILIIRSHGVPKKVYDIAAENEVEIVDATCPFVKKIHRLVEEESGRGKKIIIAGDSTHPEVRGITGWSSTDTFAVNNETEAEGFSAAKNAEYFLVSQTTFNDSKFQYIVENIKEKGYNISAVDTICSATAKRQDEARELAARVDSMIVIGDNASSNTRKLYEISKEYCKNTYHVQTVKD